MTTLSPSGLTVLDVLAYVDQPRPRGHPKESVTRSATSGISSVTSGT